MLRTYSESSIDDLMRVALEDLIAAGEPITPTRGAALEFQGVTLELLNPRARLSRSEGRGRLFSAIGELCWYLAGSNETDRIAYYIPQYRSEDEEGVVHGAYGPRLFHFDGIDQVNGIIAQLRAAPSSRRAVIQIFDRVDLLDYHRDVPCTCTMQFFVRDNALTLITHMRSNDVYRGLPLDVFAFTTLQELIARSLGIELGRYIHMVGSFHVYERDIDLANSYLGEGWQSSIGMPPMPPGDQFESVAWLLKQEQAIRTAEIDPAAIPSSNEPYWNDLALLLAMFALWKQGRSQELAELKERLSTPVFGAYLSDKFDAR